MTPPMTTKTRPIRLWKRTARDKRSILGLAFAVSIKGGLARAPVSDTGHLPAGRRRQHGMLVDAAFIFGERAPRAQYDYAIAKTQQFRHFAGGYENPQP